MSTQLVPLSSVQTAQQDLLAGYFKACREGNLPTIQKCIQDGADPLAVKSSSGRNALHLALGDPKTQNPQTIDFLTSKYPSLLNGEDFKRRRPISYVVENIYIQESDVHTSRKASCLFTSLLSAKADLSHQDIEGKNIFHEMAKCSSFSQRTFYIQTALEHVKAWSAAIKTALYSHIPIPPLNWIISSYVGDEYSLLSAQTIHDKQAPIHLAAASGATHPTVISLLSCGIDSSLQDSNGKTIEKAIKNWKEVRRALMPANEEVCR